jgi:hypothetical protein
MKRLLALAAMLLIAVSLAGCGHFLPQQGWITLIEGEKGLENVAPSGSDANWRAAEGAIVADKATQKGSSTLVSKKSFKDFDLYTEFWASSDTNSGVYIRIRDPKNVSTSTGAYRSIRPAANGTRSRYMPRAPRSR